MVISIVLMAIVVARNARRMQNQMLNAARLIADAVRGARAGSVAEGQAYEVPGIGRLTPVRLESGSGGVGKRLSEIDLHARSGAVIVAIGRDGAEVIVPTGEEVLRSGDVLELAGPSAAIASAIRLLNAPQSVTGNVEASA